MYTPVKLSKKITQAMLTAMLVGLLGSGCATVDATVLKVKTGVADRFGSDENSVASTLQVDQPIEAPEKIVEKPLLLEVQEKLTTLGYYSGAADGKRDSRTEAAIQDFQLDNDLRINGRPSKSLLKRIDEALDLN